MLLSLWSSITIPDYIVLVSMASTGLGVYIALVHKTKLWYKRLVFSFICGPLSLLVCCWFMLWDWLVQPRSNLSSLSIYYETQDGMPVDVALLTVYRQAWRKGFFLALSVLFVSVTAGFNVWIYFFK